MEIIKPGDPQPSPCKRCGDSCGYKVLDSVKGYYEGFYEYSGQKQGGSYGDTMRTTRQFKSAVCLNCNGNLNFKLDRTDA